MFGHREISTKPTTVQNTVSNTNMTGAIFRPRLAKPSDTSAKRERDEVDPPKSLVPPANCNLPGESGAEKNPKRYKSTDPSQVVELTKNDYYCISKLPALPSVLARKNQSRLLNGYSDSISNYAVLVSEEGIFVWPYKSIDSRPLTIEFPVADFNADGILPLAILTKPASGATKDPGIVIINAASGLLKFYESVQHSPALGLIGDKNLEISVPLRADKGEFITFAENVEPAGIVVVTSTKRVVLVSLRDHKSKPQLASLELMKPASKGITTFFNGSNEVNEDIICIRTGKITDKSQEVIIQEASGLVNIFTIQLSAVSGVPQLDDSKTFSQHLTHYVESSLDGFDTIASSQINYLDIWQLNSTTAENVYLILCLIVSPNETALLVLVTAKIDQSGVLVYGSHRSSRFKGVEDGAKPRFFIPGPESTAFIVVNNSIILTDIDYSYILSKGTVLYYKPRWEDIITFNNEVEIIGCGYENKSADSNPALLLLTSQSGVIRVERFGLGVFIPNETSLDPVKLVKSHIEQAIFYASSSSIDFDLPGMFSSETVSDALLLIVDEILHSTSQYLPQYLPTVTALLEKKSQLFKTLLDYCARNFSQLNHEVMVSMVHALEKTEVSFYLWNTVDSDEKSKLRDILKSAIQQTSPDQPETDLIRKYFNEDIDSINFVFLEFLNKIIEASVASDVVLGLITHALYDGILANEMKYSQQLKNKKSWIFDTDLILVVEGYFQRRYCNDSSTFTNTPETRKDIGKLCHVLYYFINEAITFMKTDGSEELTNYVRWYNKNRTKWVQCLLSNNLNEEASLLVEQYQDFNSLSEILEEEREYMVDQYGLNTVEYDGMLAKYYVYFEKYQYQFAKALFDYYLKHDKVQILLTGFPRYSQLLNQYFENNTTKVSQVAWIKKLLDSDFKAASQFLLTASETHPEEKQTSQELKFSLAKLSALASKDSTVEVDENMFRIETKLILIRIQKSVFQYISEALIKMDGGEDLKFESFIKFLNEKIDKNTAKSVFEPSFKRFINNQSIPELLLIDYLTFVKPSGKFSNGFANAFKVATLLPTEEAYKLETKKIWCRLLAITDTWDDLRNTEDQTDEFVKRKVQNSVLYKTVVSFDDKPIRILEEMLKDNESIFEEENVLVAETNKSFFNMTVKNVREYDLMGWIRSFAHSQH